MPKVGKANYPYTLKGAKDAIAHSKRTGESLEAHEYDQGGKVPEYQYGGRVPMGRPGMPSRRGMAPRRNPRMVPGRKPLGPGPRRPMPRLRPPLGPGIGRPGVPGYKRGGKVPSIGAIVDRLASLTGYKRGGKVKKGKK